MGIQFNFRNMSQGNCGANTCLDKFGCPTDRCPDFTIRRHDTKPPFRVKLEDCGGPLDVQGLVVEVNMWALAKLKKNITAECEYFALADGIGFDQIMVGDIIIFHRVRSPEYMLVLGFDECNGYVRVQRGYRNTTPSKWKKGTVIRIFRAMNAPAQTEMVFDDVQEVDGTITTDVLSEAFVVYEWLPEDTCLPGCYWLEFKILKMKGLVLYLPSGYWTGEIHQEDTGVYYTGTLQTDASVKLSYDSVEDKYFLPADQWDGAIHLYSAEYYTGTEHNDGSVVLDRTDRPSDLTVAYDSTSEETGIVVEVDEDESESFPTSITPCSDISTISCAVSFTDPDLSSSDFGCMLGENVEWIRRFPLSGEGFLIKIIDSPTREF